LKTFIFSRMMIPVNATVCASATRERVAEMVQAGAAGFLLNGLIVGTIFLNILVVVLETVPSIEARWGRVFLWVTAARLRR